jgi:hypothetical protein
MRAQAMSFRQEIAPQMFHGRFGERIDRAVYLLENAVFYRQQSASVEASIKEWEGGAS